MRVFQNSIQDYFSQTKCMHTETSEFLQNHSSILADCEESVDTDGSQLPLCNKDTGEKQVMRKWPHGLFHFVCGGGHADQWNPLYV